MKKDPKLQLYCNELNLQQRRIGQHHPGNILQGPNHGEAVGIKLEGREEGVTGDFIWNSKFKNQITDARYPILLSTSLAFWTRIVRITVLC